MNDTQILNEVLDILNTNLKVDWTINETSPEEEFENIIDFIHSKRNKTVSK